MNCIFCAIANGNIPATKVYEDDMCTAFNDLNPQAPVHILVVPKIHISSMNDITEENSKYVSHIFEKIPSIAKQLNLSDGYRVISNCGENAGQTVMHLHFHILGGTKFHEGMV